MNLRIHRSEPKGTVYAPPSKSMAHRLLICAAMAEGISTIRGINSCLDVLATIDSLTALGVNIDVSDSVVTVKGIDMRSASPRSALNCSESGSTLRFLIPPALLSGKNAIFFGAPSLMRRPMNIYNEICDNHGMLCHCDGNTVAVRGPLKSGEYEIAGNVSSQFISGLLFALPILDSDSKIKIIPPVESRSYIDLTIEALSYFGVRVRWIDDTTLFIKGKQKYLPTTLNVEGDYSASAFIDALSVFGYDVRTENLNPNSIQGDKVYKTFYEMLKRGVPTIHIADCPDLGPILFAVAAAKHGGVFTGTKRLKIKESDRASAMATELSKFGVSVKVLEDKVIVYPASFHAPSEPLLGHNDHRIVMALSILLTLTGGTIKGAEAVKKSYPDFFDDLSSLGVKIEKI